jgi:beta-glucosidase
MTANDEAALVARLDLPARVRLLTGAAMFSLHPEPALGLAEIRLSDGPNGVRGAEFVDGPIACLLPNASLLAAAWDPANLYEAGTILAEEAMAQRVHVVLGPTINLHRSPLGGRLFEAFSEDPLLTGQLATAYVCGLQNGGIGACLKHLVANESETQRTTVDSRVDPTTLREVYLLPFEIAVADADPWTIMAAYNDVNGVPATEQRDVITGIVKGEWGYAGLVMSDWFATKSTAPSARAGLDLVMPGPAGPWGDALVDAVRAGEVPEDDIDEHLRRLLVLAGRVGALGTPRQWPADLPSPTGSRRRGQLVRLAASAMTVLRNQGGVLPLAPTASVAVIGRHAVDTIGMGGGSARVNAAYVVSVADGLAATMDVPVTVVDGVEVRSRPRPARPQFVRDPVTGEPGSRITLTGPDGKILDDFHSGSSSVLVNLDDRYPEPVTGVRLRAEVTAGQVDVGVIGAGTWSWRAGERGFTAELAPTAMRLGEEILRPPAARHPVVLNASTTVEAEAAVGAAGHGVFALSVAPAHRDDATAVAEAAAAAASADVAVVVVGLTEEQETEAVDKTTLRLPGAQDELVVAVAAAARRTVVVVNAATPVLMPWLDDVDAVLWVGLPGQEAGHAVAAALLGTVEPAGRLVTTFPIADRATPAWSVTPVDGVLAYREGLFPGHRGHAAGLAPGPLFWFGHGLGYTTWEYHGAALHGDDGDIVVTVALTNTGGRVGREVVQVYEDPLEAGRPIRLVGWGLADAEPGQRVTVRVRTDARMWRRWRESTSDWQPTPPRGRLLVARGLGDIRLELPVPQQTPQPENASEETL